MDHDKWIATVSKIDEDEFRAEYNDVAEDDGTKEYGPPELKWQTSYMAGSCVSCRRVSDRVLVIAPRYNGGFVMRMCSSCIREVAATSGYNIGFLTTNPQEVG